MFACWATFCQFDSDLQRGRSPLGRSGEEGVGSPLGRRWQRRGSSLGGEGGCRLSFLWQVCTLTFFLWYTLRRLIRRESVSILLASSEISRLDKSHVLSHLPRGGLRGGSIWSSLIGVRSPIKLHLVIFSGRIGSEDFFCVGSLRASIDLLFRSLRLIYPPSLL